MMQKHAEFLVALGRGRKLISEEATPSVELPKNDSLYAMSRVPKLQPFPDGARSSKGGAHPITVRSLAPHPMMLIDISL
jgi:hypothetical protein